MDKVINTISYGFGIFSVDTMTEFLAEKKIRSKKVLALLQKEFEFMKQKATFVTA